MRFAFDAARSPHIFPLHSLLIAPTSCPEAAGTGNHRSASENVAFSGEVATTIEADTASVPSRVSSLLAAAAQQCVALRS